MRCLVLALSFVSAAGFAAEPLAIRPGKMARVGTVDERFQSFNIEMVEITGGRFWAPYKKTSTVAAEDGGSKAGGLSLGSAALDASAFRNRPAVDLSNPRLRKLAAALGPAYMRVSGSWANSVYFQDSDEAAAAHAPTGFSAVLTRREWKGVIDFSRAVNAKLVTSFAISDGVRDESGVWTPKEAQKILAFTKANGGSIAAAELFNEPSFASVAGAPKGYNAESYGRDFKAFRAFAKKAAPDMVVLGPGSIGEAAVMSTTIPMLKSEDLLTASGPGVDAFSYHFYPAVSKRCTSMMPKGPQPTAEADLTDEMMSRTDRDYAFYAKLRDRFEPGKPIWLTETGEAACGGDPWATQFIDSFRYLDQLGRLAKKGVQVVAQNTLAASDYGLIDEETLEPRPNYWAALLWHKMMGTTVLDAGIGGKDVHVYAHCLRGHPGGVAVLAMNLSRESSGEIDLPLAGERYLLTTDDLLSSRAVLNGKELRLGAGDAIPEMAGAKIAAGNVELPKTSIAFFAFANANNASCR